MNALVVGGSGGIGLALVKQLLVDAELEQVFATWYRHLPRDIEHPRLTWIQLDVQKEAQVAQLAEKLPRLDLLINTVGMLHTPEHGPEKTLRNFDPDFFLENIRTNTLPSLLLAKHFATHLRHSSPSTFAVLSAKVGSISDNRLGGWISYRSSKAALNMALKTLAVEWRQRVPNCSIAALHPGTVATSLSQPFQANVPSEKLFSAEYAASCLLRVIGGLSPANSGKLWSWDGTVLPW